MKNLILVICFSLFLSSSLSANTTDLAYNKLAIEKFDGLKYDGYIIGIEKRERDEVSVQETYDHDKFKLLAHGLSSDLKIIDCRNDEFKDVTNDEKIMLVTHIIEYSRNDQKGLDIYNPYKNNPNPKLSYQEGYKALDLLNLALRKKITVSIKNKNPYTHIIVMSMGWHNDQKESIKRYNKIMSNIENHKNDTKIFNPLVLGLTWPSAWFSESPSKFVETIGHISSYFNKSDDADEIGYTIMNCILYDLVLPIKEDYGKLGVPLKTVVIGHSMGARLLSRAIFSNDFLKDEYSLSSEVDLFIGLQAAFSANRFVTGGGAECNPYSEFNKRKTVFVLTNSILDIANPLAFWSEHIGGVDAINTIKNNEKVFFYSKWKKDDTGSYNFDKQLDYPINNKVIVANTIALNKDLLDAHNTDILTEEMGEFIWRQIEKFAAE